MKRFLLGLILLLPIESAPARSFSGGALAGGLIGGFAAGALAGSLIEKRRNKKRYYDCPPCDYNYYRSYNQRSRNHYL